MVRRPPYALLWSLAALLGLLAITVTLAYQPLGPLNGPVAVTIATLKALVVAAVFMELRPSRPLALAVACAGLCWLAILFWLSSADFNWRADVHTASEMARVPPYGPPLSGSH
jgi:cytochrome c oxidase subunit 4